MEELFLTDEAEFRKITVNNFPFPSSNIFTTENIESALSYQHRDDDIVICSYPRTGTIWIENIVLQILQSDDSFPGSSSSLTKSVPFLELTGSATVQKLNQPRIYKTQIPYNLLQTNPKAKYLYVYRDPKDTLISNYYFRMLIEGEFYNFDTFYEYFVQGDMPFGNYFDHVLSFCSSEDNANVLMISYEDLHFSRREQILKIAKFLGEKYYHMLQTDEQLLWKILTASSFDNLKKHIIQNQLLLIKNRKTSGIHDDPMIRYMSRYNSLLLRSGMIGEGEKLLTRNQLNKLDKVILDKMKGTNVAYVWLTPLKYK